MLSLKQSPLRKANTASQKLYCMNHLRISLYFILSNEISVALPVFFCGAVECIDFFVLIKCLEMSLVHYSKLLTLIVDVYYPAFGINHKTSFPHQHNIMPISLYLERNSRFDQTATQRKTTKAC